jgi:hypothetical protein
LECGTAQAADLLHYFEKWSLRCASRLCAQLRLQIRRILQGTDLPAIDFTLLARGQGVEAVTVSDPVQLAAVLVEVDVV